MFYKNLINVNGSDGGDIYWLNMGSDNWDFTWKEHPYGVVFNNIMVF